MAVPSIPQNFYVQTANQEVYLLWGISAGATSYTIQRSADNITFATIGTTASTSYLDDTALLGVQYWYQVAATNASGTGLYAQAQSAIPSPTAEMPLADIRLRAQQRADLVNSKFITLPEWNFFINQAMFELYDLLITSYSDEYSVATPASFTANGNSYLYDLPDGSVSFTDPNGASFVPKPFYKLLGVDLAMNTAQNGWVTIHKFNFVDRNKFLYPNSASTIYGVFNCRYRILGKQIEFIPTPSGNQIFRLWYIPRLEMLLRETDTTTAGISGWLQYVIVRAAKYALDKEESDTTKLDQELVFLKTRIEAAAQNRDAGMPDTISDTRGFGGNGSEGSPGGGMSGAGW